MSKANLKLIIESIVKEETLKYLLESEITLLDADAKNIFEELKDLSSIKDELNVEKIVKELKKNIHAISGLKPKALDTLQTKDEEPKSALERLLKVLKPEEEQMSSEEEKIYDNWEKSIERAAEAIMITNLLDLHPAIDGKITINEAKYKGRSVPLNKPMRGDVKKYRVYVKDPKTGNIKKINFGDPNMKIKRDNLKRRKSFRARHKCDTAKDRTTPRYWSCKFWSKKPVSKMV